MLFVKGFFGDRALETRRVTHQPRFVRPV